MPRFKYIRARLKHMQRMKTVLTWACVVALAIPFTAPANTSVRSSAIATSGTMTGSGGTLTAARQTGQSITVQGITLGGTSQSAQFICTITFFGASTYQWNWTCSGGSITVKNSNGSVAMSGKFTNATMTLTGSGGGRGGHVTYTYKFSGTFTGSMTQSGKTQSISGSITTYATTKIANGAPGNVVSFSASWNATTATMTPLQEPFAIPGRDGQLPAENAGLIGRDEPDFRS
jgi:hypothetical protein